LFVLLENHRARDDDPREKREDPERQNLRAHRRAVLAVRAFDVPPFAGELAAATTRIPTTNAAPPMRSALLGPALGAASVGVTCGTSCGSSIETVGIASAGGITGATATTAAGAGIRCDSAAYPDWPAGVVTG
jgi:hypothetical protein